MLKVLEPIWRVMTETASRLGSDRVGAGLGDGTEATAAPNPARWKGT